MGGPLSFAQAVSEAQRHLQDALRAGMGGQQAQAQGMPPMPQQMPPQGMPPQQPMPPQMQPQQPAMDPRMMQLLAQQQMMQQPAPQMPPQAGAPAQFAKGGLAVKKMAEGGAWTRKEGKNPEGGLNAKGRASLKAQGHDIKPPVSAKQAKKSPKAAARRKSFCARMSGMEGPMKDDKGRPTRKALALRKWDC